jgi:hypothetical protein
MKNVYEVLRQKELDLSRLQREVDALRLTAPLLSEELDAGNGGQAASLGPPAAPKPPVQALGVMAETPRQTRAAGWGDKAKHWLNG